jgi:hypothetical protein
MIQDYVSRNVIDPDVPLGGRTGAVWVTDATPPVILPVSSEPIAEDTIQMTLQLNEPGTIWCAAALLDGSSLPEFCSIGEIQDTNANAICHYEKLIKGSTSDGTVFRADIHTPFRDYDIEVNKMWEKDYTGSAPLSAQTDFDILCFAEDDWRIESTTAAVNSPNFVAPGSPNKASLAHVLAIRTAIQTKKTLDTTPPTVVLSISAPSDSESSLSVHISFNEAGTLYCLPLLQGTAAPHATRIVSYDLKYVCALHAGCTGGLLTIPNLLKRTLYDVHCYAEDDNEYPQKPNGVTLPVLTALVNDITPPVITIVKSHSPENSLVVVTLQLDEEGTVFCYTPTLSNINTVGFTVQYGASTVVTAADIDRNVLVEVTSAGTNHFSYEEETQYTIFCAAKDTATNPDCSGCSVPNLSTLAEATAAMNNIGLVTTLDQSPPVFTHLGARGISETQIRVTFSLNEAGTVYCRATRTDAGEPTLHINHIIQAGFVQVQQNDTTPSKLELDIDKLTNQAGESLLMSGTGYDVYCWARDVAELITCTPVGSSAVCIGEATPNYMLQTYVDTPFSTALFPPYTQANALGGRIDMVRTWDTTPPNLIFVEAESRQETSITVTLQLNEPGTAYCRAFPDIDPNSASFADVVNAPGGPFWFELPSDSATRIYSAHEHRNFEITVTGLMREVLYFVYCAAQDDESQDGCGQRDSNDDPACSSNPSTPYLTEVSGRFTLDLTPPVMTLMNTVSVSQDSITALVNLDEAGTTWCAAVLDRFPPPTVNQIVAAGFQTLVDAPGAVNVTVTGLVKDTEYDMYCFARDDGTMSAANDTQEVQLSVRNAVSYEEVLATKMDAHVIYDSMPPVLLSKAPVNLAPVAAPFNITLTFNEDVRAGLGGPILRSTSLGDVTLPATSLVFINHVGTIVIGSGAGMVASQTWRIILPEGAVLDTAGNEFAGIDDFDYQLQT